MACDVSEVSVERLPNPTYLASAVDASSNLWRRIGKPPCEPRNGLRLCSLPSLRLFDIILSCPDGEAMMRLLVHHKLMIDTLILGLGRLSLQHILRLLRVLGTHLHVDLGRRARKWQQDHFDIARVFDVGRMCDEAAVDETCARISLGLIPAELCYVFGSPAEASSSNGQIGSFIRLHSFEEVVDLWAGDGFPAVPKKARYKAHEIQCVLDFVELVPEACCGHGLEAGHDICRHDEACSTGQYALPLRRRGCGSLFTIHEVGQKLASNQWQFIQVRHLEASYHLEVAILRILIS